MNRLMFWLGRNRQKLLVLLVWLVAVAIGIFAFSVIKNKSNSGQVAGVSTDNSAVNSSPTDAPTDIPADTPLDTPTPYSSDSGVSAINSPADSPTDSPTSSPTEAPTPVPTATPTPVPTAQTYQASVTSINPSGSISADGISQFTIVAKVTDQNNNAVGGVTVGLNSSDPNIAFTPSDSSNISTDSSGNATFTATSSIANTYSFQVFVYHIAVTTSGGVSLTFSPVPTTSPTPTDLPTPSPT